MTNYNKLMIECLKQLIEWKCHTSEALQWEAALFLFMALCFLPVAQTTLEI